MEVPQVGALEKAYEERLSALLNVKQRVFEKSEETMWEHAATAPSGHREEGPEVWSPCAIPVVYF